MIERVIENWLDNASERSFQKPFCYMLAAKGYTVVHITRHCPMELGKDILAISPDGIPCAFQLKTAHGGKISLAQWRKEIQPQINDLVTGSIVHPSIPTNTPHRAYLVTNGEFEEEVIRSIDDFNRGCKHSDQKLNTFVRGELLKMASDLEDSLWPTELKDVNLLLEMYLNDGRGVLPKKQIASLLESILPFNRKKSGKAPSKQECSRAISSGALLCSMAVSKFSNNQNHVAEIEAWTLYLSYMMGLVQKWRLPKRYWEKEFNITREIIFNSLGCLFDEISERRHYVEGDSLVDAHVYKIRLTWLIGLMSIYALWLTSGIGNKDEASTVLARIREFIIKNRGAMTLWGEGAIPQFLAYYWYSQMIDGSYRSDFILSSLIESICKYNKEKKDHFLANPYYEAEEILSHMLKFTDEPMKESFVRRSYMLEGIVHLYVRCNWKQNMKLLWPDVTRFSFMRFDHANSWEFFKWRADKGTLRSILCKHRKSWNELKNEAHETEGKCIPPVIKKHPILLLLMMCVYPHRMNSDIMRWLDTEVSTIRDFEVPE